MKIESQMKYIIDEMAQKDKAACFTPKDFIHLGNYDAIKKALERMAKSGAIRRVTRGIYDIPRKSDLLGDLSPDISQVVEAIARRDQIRVQPTGAQAANLLGLSEQVPAKIIYLTDGRAKKIKVGNATIIFKPAGIRDMSLANTLLGLIVQSLKNLGKTHVDKMVANKLKKIIKDNPNEEVEKKLGQTPIWIAEFLKNKVLRDSNA